MRERLPERRPSVTFPLVFHPLDGNSQHYRCTASFALVDGIMRVREVFANGSAITSREDIAARDAAILVSLHLQHGGDLQALADAMSRGEDGRPHGLAGALCDGLLHIEKGSAP